MIEIEIKAKVDNFESIKKQLKKLKAKFVKTEKMADHIFGRDKDLDKEHKMLEGTFIARIREKNNKKFLEFKEVNRRGPCMEFNSDLANLESGLNFLNKLDFKKAFTVSKIREIYKYLDFEICLDDVDQLGLFIEIEHSQSMQDCQNLLKIIAPDAVIENKKYGDLMQELINKQNEN
jgi:adenylate cyclase, class 2